MLASINNYSKIIIARSQGHIVITLYAYSLVPRLLAGVGGERERFWYTLLFFVNAPICNLRRQFAINFTTHQP